MQIEDAQTKVKKNILLSKILVNLHCDWEDQEFIQSSMNQESWNTF